MILTGGRRPGPPGRWWPRGGAPAQVLAPGDLGGDEVTVGLAAGCGAGGGRVVNVAGDDEQEGA